MENQLLLRFKISYKEMEDKKVVDKMVKKNKRSIKLRYKKLKILHEEQLSLEHSFNYVYSILFTGKERLWYKLTK